MNVTWIPAWEEALPPRVRGVLWRSRRALRHRLRAIALTPGRNESIASREELAIKYVRGEGIEIGALNMPLQLPAGTRVQYVDHAPTEELQRTYWHGIGRHNSPLVATDVVDDAEHLHSFADASLDFVVANHVLEHTEDPLGTLQNFLRVLRPGGVLLLTLPDARYTFDVARPRTTLEHILHDHEAGPDSSRREHYEECARIVDGLSAQALERRVAELEAAHERIHFHVWELESFLEMLPAFGLPADLMCAQAVLDEFSVVLRKRGG